MSLIIAGDRSGTGKTTITLALLSFLRQKGAKVQSFKVGPDYIDPMFHTYITGRPCRNLDPILTSPSYVKTCFAQHSQGVDYAVIEGVMGLFDGIPFQEKVGEKESFYQDYGSTAHTARLLNLPVVLVIDCSRLSGSVAAIVHGYRSLDPNLNLIGVILNRVASDRHYKLLETALKPLNINILGVIPRKADLNIPERHLGLVPAQEIPQITTFFDKLAHLAENCLNWEQLLPYLTPSHHSSFKNEKRKSSINIAIASDQAFNFYYPDNLDILENLGANLTYWSPLEDKTFPPNTAGLYLGGGFPEMFAQVLANNKPALNTVKAAIIQGMPTYAECGGLMYLCEYLIDFQEKSWPMVGILPTTAKVGQKLTLGYKKAIVSHSSLLFSPSDKVWGHEFHRSQLSATSPQPLFQLSSWYENSPVYEEGWYCYNLHASYLHLHFGGCPQIPEKFMRHALDFSGKLALD